MFCSAVSPNKMKYEFSTPHIWKEISVYVDYLAFELFHIVMLVRKSNVDFSNYCALVHPLMHYKTPHPAQIFYKTTPHSCIRWRAVRSAAAGSPYLTFAHTGENQNKLNPRSNYRIASIHIYTFCPSASKMQINANLPHFIKSVNYFAVIVRRK